MMMRQVRRRVGTRKLLVRGPTRFLSQVALSRLDIMLRTGMHPKVLVFRRMIG